MILEELRYTNRLLADLLEQWRVPSQWSVPEVKF